MYRRERGVCRICWTEQDETIDFQLSGGSAAGGMYKLENADTFPSLYVNILGHTILPYIGSRVSYYLGNGYSSSQCCGYGVALTKIANGYDCVMIPGIHYGI